LVKHSTEFDFPRYRRNARPSLLINIDSLLLPELSDENAKIIRLQIRVEAAQSDYFINCRLDQHKRIRVVLGLFDTFEQQD
jgi:hypothetical protein